MTLVPTYGVLPALGYGTFKRLGDECYGCVTHALETGYRHIDTAVFYNNEIEVGKAIRESGVARDDVFLTTKVWFDCLGAGQVRASAEGSLERLGLDQVDLLLIHWPSPKDEVPLAQYMEEIASLKAAGLTKHIGVSNFTKRHIDEAIEVVGVGEIATNQCELNVTFHNTPIVEHCNSLGIPMTAYLPLARGSVAANGELERLAQKHDATASQIALAWLLAKGHIAIPTSSKKERIEENFGALNISLSAGDLMALDGLGTDNRLVDVEWSPNWDR
ncbi:MAG: aldo/keto reductase [Boseongicola sp.]|nr:aldo/keto reductase [Boseongicola sp.]MDD9979311.1 aldo/keto reductase [Boseongicola sp.]